jgi:hypothetical protein
MIMYTFQFTILFVICKWNNLKIFKVYMIAFIPILFVVSFNIYLSLVSNEALSNYLNIKDG